MLFQDQSFYLCRIPLDAASADDVEVLRKAKHTDNFTELFNEFEEKRSHAFNEDGLYGVVRAEEIFTIVRTQGDDYAREKAFEEVKSNLITNLEHRVMHKNDQKAKKILRDVHGIEQDFQTSS